MWVRGTRLGPIFFLAASAPRGRMLASVRSGKIGCAGGQLDTLRRRPHLAGTEQETFMTDQSAVARGTAKFDLSEFPITRRWPPQDPGVLQLYSFPTPNGVKVSIMLEETGVPYEPHRVTLDDADVKSPEFLSLNPNNKIPAIIDPDGPDGMPLGLAESGAILLYLAEKTGSLIGETAMDRHRITQWIMFQMGHVGPMFGQLGFFVKFKGAEVQDPIPRERYVGEAQRILGVIEGQLDGRDWIAGGYSIADIAIAPWLNALDFYGAREMVGWSEYPRTVAYLDRFMARSAVDRGRTIPSRDG
jgi:GST-like protein